MAGTPLVRIGTRGSALALAQTALMARALEQAHPGLQTETVVIRTTGDQNQESPLSQIGSKGLFTKEIEDALLAGQIDLAVHSLKDLPSEIPGGLAIGAVTERERPSDLLISHRAATLKKMSAGAVIGTSSLRRQAQIRAQRPDLRVENLRGNLDTRIRKLRQGAYDAIVVAEAGVARLNREDLLEGLHRERIGFTEMLPAVGQGSLAIEIRADDAATERLVSALNHAPSRTAAECERAFLKTLEGGCQVPIGALARVDGEELRIDGVIASPAGDMQLRASKKGPAADAARIGRELAEELLSRGGRKILDGIRTAR